MNDQPLNRATEEAAEFYDANYAGSSPLFLWPGRRIVLGSKDDRVCRFCGKDETNTSFRLEAHAIPELLGNKSISSNYECDDCNQFFGSGIENDLGNWTKPSRTIARIRGKTGVPSIKKGGTDQGWRIDYDAAGFHFKDYESDPHFVVDEEKRQLRVVLTRDVFTPIAVLKAFVKIGLTLLPPEEVPNFKETLSWIREADHTRPFVAEFPVFHTFQPGPMRNDLLVAMIMRRRESISDLPYAFMVLGFGNDVYQVFLPCPVQDRAIHGKQLTIPAFPKPEGPDPLKYGKARVRLIDLCGKHPVRGETVPITLGFHRMEVRE